MSKRCELTGKQPTYGNRRSFSNRASRRRWEINLQPKKVYVLELDLSFNLLLSTHALKTIQKQGGLFQAILKADESLMSDKLLKIKKAVMKKYQKKVKATEPEKVAA